MKLLNGFKDFAVVLIKIFLIAALCVIGLNLFSQQNTVIKIPPVHDTTVIKFVTTTTYTVSTIPVDTSVSTPGGYQLIYTSGYDSQGDLDPDNHGQAGNGFIDFQTFKTGPGSFRSRPASISSGIRSEVQYNDNRTPIEGAIEYDVKYNVIIRDGCHSFQFHPNNNGSAVLSLFHTAGKFDVTLSRNGTNYRQSDGSGPLITILSGQWYHMRLEYKFSNTAGYSKWYINGSLYYISPQTFLGDGSGQYLKIGFNGGFWGSQDATTSDINYDNLKIYKKV